MRDRDDEVVRRGRPAHQLLEPALEPVAQDRGERRVHRHPADGLRLRATLVVGARDHDPAERQHVEREVPHAEAAHLAGAEPGEAEERVHRDEHDRRRALAPNGMDHPRDRCDTRHEEQHE
jgi:hypothetical protein